MAPPQVSAAPCGEGSGSADGFGRSGFRAWGCVFWFRAQVFGGSEFGRLKVQGSSVP